MKTPPPLLDEQTHAKIYEKIIRFRLFHHVKSTPTPTLIMIGGQPGAGKTKATNQAQLQLQISGYGAALINGDDLRPFHPHYRALVSQDKSTAAEKTGLDVGLWVERAIREAGQKKFNTVVETTLRQPDKVRETLESFKANGFITELRVLIVDKAYSNLGIYQRFARGLSVEEAAPRFTPQRFHETTLANMPHSIEVAAALVDRTLFINREGRVLFDSKTATHSATAALAALRQQQLSPRELAEVALQWQSLRNALDREGVPLPIRIGVREHHTRALLEIKVSAKAQKEYENLTRVNIPASLKKPSPKRTR
jgi:predicted ABC-type ATPase